MDETIMTQELHEKWTIFWWSFSIGLFALNIAWMRGLFKPFISCSYPLIRGRDLFKGFGYFIAIAVFIIPALAGVIITAAGWNATLNTQTQGWLNLLVIVSGFGAVSLAYSELTPLQRKQLSNQSPVSSMGNFGVGVAVWFVFYPIVLAFSQAVSILSWHLFHHPFIEQVAVQRVREALENPFLLGATALAIVSIVPVTEEFLFRGLLQNWLKQKFHYPAAAIGISSLIFAFFHYSRAQGTTNIELLSSLFILSCVLGFIYERQRSLWAPIGLHSFFNFISLLMIVQEKP
jgi:CAAX protease family protein